ncbi:hypothetical protein CXU21_07595 [Akkermansia muciniphila]|nr:hypothetical protein CXU21_07595 [Akkermansia muciniphila]
MRHLRILERRPLEKRAAFLLLRFSPEQGFEENGLLVDFSGGWMPQAFRQAHVHPRKECAGLERGRNMREGCLCF